MTRVVRAATAIGVDGYLGGWVAVELGPDGTFARAWPGATLAGLLGGVGPGTAIGVDIPIGSVESGWRSADIAAQARLGSRRSTVFSVPPRQVWDLPTHREASERCRELTGSGFSVQAYHLLPKMREAEALQARGDVELFEVHPELVFAAMAAAPPPSKKTWAGQAVRRTLLAEVGIELPDDIGPAGVVPPDDVLDASAVAWCAYRFGRGGAGHVPDPPDQFDRAGRPIVIWY